MDSPTRQRYETQSKHLRVKIKSWEVAFQTAHDGAKPSRKDIKASAMAGTYKEYQRLGDLLSGKLPRPPAPKNPTGDNQRRKRKSPDLHAVPSHTPITKRFKAVETPSASRGQNHGHSIAINMFTPGSAAAGTTPSLSRKLFDSSPAIPTFIGPTPQRDGHVLGLFDSLPFKDADIDSPSKPNGVVRLSQALEAGRHVMAPQQLSQPASRLSAGQPSTAGAGAGAALGHTPSSRHKRLLSTPQKPDGPSNSRAAKTPGTAHSSSSSSRRSASRLQFQTPAFLRRIPMPRITEADASPELGVRLPRKPLLRGLSSVVADLRRMQQQQQEEEHDDDLDALREAEMDMEGGGGSGSGPSKPVNRTIILSDKTSNLPATTAGNEPAHGPADAQKRDNAAILEADSERQALNLLGGFDDEGAYDSAGEQDAGLDRYGNPLRVYKKKGQKRTTRKSNMKPVRKCRDATATAAPADAGDGEAGDNRRSTRTSRATKATPAEGEGDADADADGEEHAQAQDADDPALHSGSEFAASDGDEDELALDHAATPPPTTTTATKRTAGRPPAQKAAATAAAAAKKTAAAPPPPPPPPPPRRRKVNAHAHANFKRLKLRNTGAKGGPGHSSRFRRQRR